VVSNSQYYRFSFFLLLFFLSFLSFLFFLFFFLFCSDAGSDSGSGSGDVKGGSMEVDEVNEVALLVCMPSDSDDSSYVTPTSSSDGDSEYSDDEGSDIIEDTVDSEDLVFVDCSKLPRWLAIVKLHAAGTALFQPNDVAKAHSTMNTYVHYDTRVLLEGRDEGLAPDYMTTVDRALREGGVPPSSRRTYTKFLLNAEVWVNSAFRSDIMRAGWAKSGQWPWNLSVFMSRFSGFSEGFFDDLPDFKMNELLDSFGQLIFIAFGVGVLHKSTVNRILGNWIAEVQTATVSREARYNLVLYELHHGAIEDMHVRNFSSCILTNPKFR
jgi:hypothetical protein